MITGLARRQKLSRFTSAVVLQGTNIHAQIRERLGVLLPSSVSYHNSDYGAET